MGYYNGAEIGSLADESVNLPADDVDRAIRDTATALAEDRVLSGLATLEVRRTQISIRPHDPACIERLWHLAEAIVGRRGLRSVRSTHSIDVLLPQVTKQTLVEHLQTRLAGDLSVLTIGDRGGVTGNDYELLQTEFSLSVDEVSPSLVSCWNLAPPGMRGVQATLWYLQGIHGDCGSFTVDSQHLRGTRRQVRIR